MEFVSLQYRITQVYIEAVAECVLALTLQVWLLVLRTNQKNGNNWLRKHTFARGLKMLFATVFKGEMLEMFIPSDEGMMLPVQHKIGRRYWLDTSYYE